MRVVFMGTPSFAVPALKKLAAAHEVVLVLTRPDAVRSRGKRLEPSPVKSCALELGLSVLEAKHMTDEVLDALREASADVFCVAAYGCILPDEVLTMAPLGCVNVHASLLPRWRGAAPIQRCILAGDDETGVSIMRIGHGVDTGAFCAQASCAVAGKTADELTAELAELGGNLLVDTLPALADGTAVWTEQDESLVTHAAKIEKSELRLDAADSVTDNLRRVLASSDAAPARCVVAGKPVRVLMAADARPDAPRVEEGSFAVASKRVFIGCSDGVLEILSVKPDGKRAMDAQAWAAGLQGKQGAWETLS
ncbi:methionyl-tRNA formyltransferase [Collinsella tanakaei]|nr:methionyl-tRNA formyltransferase [Collinsella tanakaei]